jgi:hypothetical protein
VDAGAGHDPPSPATSLSLDAGTLIPRGSVARRGFRMNPDNSVQPSALGGHAKGAKELPIFTVLMRKISEIRFGRFRPASSSDLMSLGDSLRSWRSWR